MQGWTGCSNLSASQSTTLVVSRDNTSYTVTKLADGNCWMTENLRLDLSNSTITSADTNNPTAGFLSLVSTPQTDADDWNDDPDQILYLTEDGDHGAHSHYSNEYGTYYNWYTATAGNGTYDKTSGNTSGDICPSGWHLPEKDEYDDLITDSGATILNSSPNNFVLSGYVNLDVTSSLDEGANGYYWTSTADGIYDAHALSVDGTGSGTYNNSKYEGLTGRCLTD